MAIVRASAVDRKPGTAARKVTTAATQQVLSKRAENVQSIFTMAAAGCIMKGYFADAGAINMHSEAISTEVAKLADTDERVAKLVDSLASVGPLGGILMATLPLAMQLAANHGRIDPDRAGGVGGIMTPADLESKVKLQIQRERASIMAEIKALQAENPPAEDAA
jgi:hypothetical protein